MPGRTQLHQRIVQAIVTAFSRDLWRLVGRYVGIGKPVTNEPIHSLEALGTFVKTRSSHVAQTSLYGYLKTRAGTRFPEMFEDPGMLLSINMAKWQIYVACISDLSVYAGALIHRRTGIDNETIARQLSCMIAPIIEEIGAPDEAGPDFAHSIESMKIRLASIDYTAVGDDESAFSASPDALYTWSPIANELKSRDREIVRNSIRFRWKDVRASIRELLDARTVVSSCES